MAEEIELKLLCPREALDRVPATSFVAGRAADWQADPRKYLFSIPRICC